MSSTNVLASSMLQSRSAKRFLCVEACRFCEAICFVDKNFLHSPEVNLMNCSQVHISALTTRSQYANFVHATYHSSVLLAQEVPDFHFASLLGDGQVDGEVSVHRPHCVLEALQQKYEA